MAPGMLYVTMQPEPGLSLDQFHEWYNNEHGPTRLRLPQIFLNGLRYRATDGLQPEFLAAYDVTHMSHLETPTYTDLRANRSQREAETIGQVDVKRYFFDEISAHSASPTNRPARIEHYTDDEAEGTVLVSVELSLKSDTPEAEEAAEKWYTEEHIPMLRKIPGWLRTRILRTSSLEESSEKKIVALHDYAKDNGLEGPEHKAAMASTSYRDEVWGKYVANKTRRQYKLFYVFGPAPRDLSSLSRLPASAAFTSSDSKTSTTPGSSAVIRSFVTGTQDGVEIPYRLEGNPAPGAPTVAFCNSLLTSLEMWDEFIKILKAKRPDLRILRYDTRGRHAIPSSAEPVPATLDLLADDLAEVLAALRIPKLHALIGVSMGGATTLKFALKYPQKLSKFIACDFNVASSEANTKAWKERIALAEEDIGKLAGLTVERWFHPHTMTDKKAVAQWMTDMVAANNVQGFKFSCQALWDYNMRDEMKECCVPGLFVVGEGDGKGALVKAMDGFKHLLGKDGAELKVVPMAGHLPMSESPEAFWEAVDAFL
ncbi:Alpha/Beta hydrolase protein [Diplogelasinospora grovesii]|uniref:Alpha/Beta hydrolase protein n=1 Tax=Diplogelasinospora grovesii TaxID=303347 RepID=A0AAN6RZP7_9PEZI|nr:Alpha/Beta hydrolase protein [Diplogelasinospora grovesii]